MGKRRGRRAALVVKRGQSNYGQDKLFVAAQSVQLQLTRTSVRTRRFETEGVCLLQKKKGIQRTNLKQAPFAACNGLRLEGFEGGSSHLKGRPPKRFERSEYIRGERVDKELVR